MIPIEKGFRINLFQYIQTRIVRMADCKRGDLSRRGKSLKFLGVLVKGAEFSQDSAQNKLDTDEPWDLLRIQSPRYPPPRLPPEELRQGFGAQLLERGGLRG